MPPSCFDGQTVDLKPQVIPYFYVELMFYKWMCGCDQKHDVGICHFWHQNFLERISSKYKNKDGVCLELWQYTAGEKITNCVTSINMRKIYIVFCHFMF